VAGRGRSATAEPTYSRLVARFRDLAPEEMTAEQRAVVEAIVAGPRGAFGGPFSTLLRSPELADRVQALGEAIRFRSSLPPTCRELAILVVASRWKAAYEWQAHREIALEVGVEPAAVEALEAGRPPELPAGEHAAYAFVRELAETGRVSDEAFAAAHEAFGEQGVVDLLGLAGYYTLLAFVLNAAD
jgi:4-carboxymuconolactone decarboxylase